MTHYGYVGFGPEFDLSLARTEEDVRHVLLELFKRRREEGAVQLHHMLREVQQLYGRDADGLKLEAVNRGKLPVMWLAQALFAGLSSQDEDGSNLVVRCASALERLAT